MRSIRKTLSNCCLLNSIDIFQQIQEFKIAYQMLTIFLIIVIILKHFCIECTVSVMKPIKCVLNCLFR